MSASKPRNRREYIDYCLRRLGEPVIRVNVAEEQVQDLVDEAVEFFQRNHYDGSHELHLPLEITQETKAQGYFNIDDSIIAINRVLDIGSMSYSGTDGMLNSDWQTMASTMSSNGLGAGGCDGPENYFMFLSSRETFKHIIGTKHTLMSWSRHMDKFFINSSDRSLKVGNFVVVDAVRVLIPDEYPQVWDDPFLKRYGTALIKRQWGNNLRKMRNIPLAGGIALQGEEILQEAQEEIATLEEEIQTQWQEPPCPLVG